MNNRRIILIVTGLVIFTILFISYNSEINKIYSQCKQTVSKNLILDKYGVTPESQFRMQAIQKVKMRYLGFSTVVAVALLMSLLFMGDKNTKHNT